MSFRMCAQTDLGLIFSIDMCCPVPFRRDSTNEEIFLFVQFNWRRERCTHWLSSELNLRCVRCLISTIDIAFQNQFPIEVIIQYVNIECHGEMQMMLIDAVDIVPNSLSSIRSTDSNHYQRSSLATQDVLNTQVPFRHSSQQNPYKMIVSIRNRRSSRRTNFDRLAGLPVSTIITTECMLSCIAVAEILTLVVCLQPIEGYRE